MIDGPLPVPSDLARMVTDESYARLLGYPDGELVAGRVMELAAQSRDWFAAHAAPWSAARTLRVTARSDREVTLEDRTTLVSRRLSTRLADIDASALVIAVASVGEAIDTASATHWHSDRPDEAFFLDRLGAAVAVRLAAWVGEHLRSLAAERSRALGPGYSPGYDGWEVTDQKRLAGLLAEMPEPLPGPLEAFESGMIHPKNSLLAVFGLSHRPAEADLQWKRHPCSWCSLSGCGLRGWIAPSSYEGT